MNLNKLMITTILLFLLVGVVSATDVADDTTSTESMNELVKDVPTTTTAQDTSLVEDKKIDKESKTHKTSSKTYNVTNFDSLHYALTNDEYDTVTVNINSNITLKSNTKLPYSISYVIINGNGNTLDGSNHYQFLDIYDQYVTINNLKIINCTSDEGGAIENLQGEVNIYNTSFVNNYARYGGAINSYTYSELVVINSTFINNKASQDGGCLYLYQNRNTIENCEFYNNTAGYEGGAIKTWNEHNLKLKNSFFFNNTAYEETGENVYIGGGEQHSYTTVIVNNNTFVNYGNVQQVYNYRDYASFYDNKYITNYHEGKDNTKIIVNSVKGIIGEKLIFTAKVTDTNNNPVPNGYVLFKLNGITIKENGKLTGSNNPLKVYVTNGVASTTVTADLNMRYAQNLTAVYSGSSVYDASRSNDAKAQLSQRNASIVVSSNVKTIKQGQTLTITARVYDTTGGKRSSTLIPFDDEFVYFKVNGITLKDSEGNMQKVKVVNGTATIKYTIPLGLSGVTDGKTFNIKNHTILAGYYNKNYQAEVRNTSTFQVERSNITITITNATVNNKTHKLSLTATIKDYLGNKVLGPNKCVVKINGATLKSGNKPIYYFANNGVLSIKDVTIPSYNNYKTIEIVTQDRLSYKSQRNTTNTIKVENNPTNTQKANTSNNNDTGNKPTSTQQVWVEGHYEGGSVVSGIEYVYDSSGLLLVDSDGNPVTRTVTKRVGGTWVPGHYEDV
ncbi:MAG: hypothetical protein BZ136_08820 [Methanosphaera sp. rholeuAM74]|nr:MAG: hypothetical protein BZ136_08820 [Methanosphaera sp. rholeuAM74]